MKRLFFAAMLAVGGIAQTVPVTPSLPNPYQTIEGYFHLPAGRVWGSTSAIDIDPDGKTIWIGERCGDNSCAGKMDPPVLKFDPSGVLLRAFGEGLILFPHGIHVDRIGNVWVTDGQAKDGGGMQVWKFSPDGRVLMTLGKPGGGSGSTGFNQPNDVIVAANGDIFVAEGHSAGTGSARIVRFDRDGKYLGEWGKRGSGPGEFDVPHALAFDSAGRLFIGDRANNRVQIFDPDGKFIAEWHQFGRPSGLFIDAKDALYVADSESTDRAGYGNNPGYERGIRIGSARTGVVNAFIPDPSHGDGATSAAEGVAVNAAGVIFGAEVGPRAVKRYVLR